MANIGMNQIVISGERSQIIDLFVTTELNFAKFKIAQINNGQFCTAFKMPFEDTLDMIIKLSKKYSELHFKLFYADKLLSYSKIVTVHDSEIETKKQELSLTLQEIKNDLSFDKAFKNLLK